MMAQLFVKKLRPARDHAVGLFFCVGLFFVPVFCGVIYSRCQFDERSVELLTVALSFQLPSMFFYVARDIMTRVFYAFRDTHTPFRIAGVALLCKALLNAIFVHGCKMDVSGISLATTIVTGLNFAVMLIVLYRRRSLSLRGAILPTAGMMLGALVCWGTVVVAYSWLRPLSVAALSASSPSLPGIELLRLLARSFSWIFSLSKLSDLISVCIAAGLGLSVYAIICWLLKIEELLMISKQARTWLSRCRILP